jgi:hypothetical protein
VTVRPKGALTLGLFRRFCHSWELLSGQKLNVTSEPRLEPKSALVLRSLDTSYYDSSCSW